MQLHQENSGENEEPFNEDEIKFMQGVLALRDKSIKSVMTSLENVFMLKMDAALDEAGFHARAHTRMRQSAAHAHTLQQPCCPHARTHARTRIVCTAMVERKSKGPCCALFLLPPPHTAARFPSRPWFYCIANTFDVHAHVPCLAAATTANGGLPPFFAEQETMTTIQNEGHSRVPLFTNSKDDAEVFMLVKDLIKLDPENATPVADAPQRKLFKMEATTSLFEAMDIFQDGDHGHIALVVDSGRSRIIGIATLEDIIEELLQEEIVDETDVYEDVERQLLRPPKKAMHRISQLALSISSLQVMYARAPGLHVSMCLCVCVSVSIYVRACVCG